MEISYDPDMYTLQDGRVVAQFVGCGVFENAKAIGKDGLPIPPGIRWTFRLHSGDDAGKDASTITPKHPTLKNACGRMIMGLTDAELDAEHPFRSEQWAGCFYMVSIRDGKLDTTPPPRYIGGKSMTPSQVEAVITGASPPGAKPGPVAGADPIPF